MSNKIFVKRMAVDMCTTPDDKRVFLSNGSCWYEAGRKKQRSVCLVVSEEDDLGTLNPEEVTSEFPKKRR